MKLILILSLIIITLTACEENREQTQKDEVPEYGTSRSMPVKVEKEITVGEATTKIIDTGINRISNINLACESISGTAVKPGEEFSFNEVVGKRSKERGYKDAPIIFHGEKSYGTGGGVCQVSTTVYMAALNAGLEITERHTHSEKVSYAPGTDATVVYGEKDMKFKNNTADTVYIYAWAQNETVFGKIVKKEYENP